MIAIYRLTSFFTLLALYFMVKTKNSFQWFIVFCRYDIHIRFLYAHILFGLLYFFINPYRASRHFLQQQGADDIYTYGETYLTVFQKIAKECVLSPRDVFFELGCGRGLGMFWLNIFTRCQVIGIEHMPLFVQKGNFLARILRCDTTFYEQDILSVDLSRATVVYFYGTNFSDAFVNQLIAKLKLLPSTTKIITVSYPLTDYSQDFEVIKTFPVHFAWGKAMMYIQNYISTTLTASPKNH
jgi:hypothetical protein